MNSNNTQLILLFFSLLFLQVVVLNNILLFGYINPYVYIAFVFVFPLNENRFPFLISSFLLGLFIDFFIDTGGIHAFSILFIAYVRLVFVKIIFRKMPADFPFFKLKLEPFGKVINYVVILTIIHHFILFSFINFSFQNFYRVFLNTLFSGTFTLVLLFLGAKIFSRNL